MTIATIACALLLPPLVFSFSIHNYFVAESYKGAGFTASLSSPEDYEVTVNPFPLHVTFSEAAMELDEGAILTSNARVLSLVRESSTQYVLEVSPLIAGPLSITLSKYITSADGKPIHDIPSLSFNYKGVSIVGVEVSKLASTEVRLRVTTTQTAELFALATTSVTPPSYRDIVSQGQQLQSGDETGVFYVDLTGLTPATTYNVFVTGRESTGTLLETPVEGTRTVLVTPQADGSTSATCRVGWSQTAEGLEQKPCSGHGRCVAGQCLCDAEYTGGNCAAARELERDGATNGTWVLHSDWELMSAATLDEELTTFWQTQMREIFADRLSVPVTSVRLREWLVFHTQVTQLVRLPRRTASQDNRSSFLLHVHVTCSVETQAMQSATEDLKRMAATRGLERALAGRGVEVETVQLRRTAVQKTTDSWSCFNGKKDVGESDVDCGGECTQGCKEGLQCRRKEDCSASLSCREGVCSSLDPATVIVCMTVATLVVGVIVFTIAVFVKDRFKRERQQSYERMSSGKMGQSA